MTSPSDTCYLVPIFLNLTHMALVFDMGNPWVWGCLHRCHMGHNPQWVNSHYTHEC